MRAFGKVALALLSAGGVLTFCLTTTVRAQDEARDAQRILVYGASGRVGSRVVREALARGHYVTAVSRTPVSITERHDHLTIVAGDILDTEGVATAATGHDVVISAVGGDNPSSADPMESIPRRAAESLVVALRGLGPDAPRMMVVGGGSTTLDERPGVPFVDPEDPPTGPRGVRMVGHRLAMEYLRGVEDVSWTFVAPPLQMRPGQRTGRFRVGPGVVLRDSAGLSAISMEDMAVAMIDEIERPRYIRGRFTAAY
jgi:putative NADH-flavin reductase